MLKGQWPANIPFDIFGVFICMVTILTLGVMLMGEMTAYAEVVDSSLEDLNSIDAAHVLEKCFSGGTGLIEWSFLENNQNTNVCNIEECNLCEMDVGLKVEILDLDKLWSFGFDTSRGTDHEIFVNIRDGEKTRVGKMYVQVL